MTIAIHQPNFVPWLGYFYKISKSDIFVVLDDVQYTKNSLINRNKIKSVNGEMWLTIPVLHTGNFGQNINETKIQFLEKNHKKIISSLTSCYSKAPYFKEILPLFQIDDFSDDNLASYNYTFIKRIVEYLDIRTPILKSSSISNVNGTSTERLVQICKQLNATKYLAGFGSRNYQDDVEFCKNGIDTVVYDFKYPEYKQLYGDFIPNLSIIDVLMNNGKNTKKFL